jgi:hypothetical protein
VTLTRRGFVAGAATAAGAMGAAVMLPAFGMRALASLPSRGERASCAILDLGDDCALRESLTGFEEALREMGVATSAVIPSGSEGSAVSLGRDGVTLVPGALGLRSDAMSLIVSRLNAGGTVVLESGAGFADAAAVAAHRDALRECFGLRVAAPTSLWATTDPQRAVPFVHYTWPHHAHVRDFSRALIVESDSGSVIAHAAGHAVATRAAHGPGALVFLGSPIGPSLRAGDREARRWLAAVLTDSARRLV